MPSEQPKETAPSPKTGLSNNDTLIGLLSIERLAGDESRSPYQRLITIVEEVDNMIKAGGWRAKG